MEAGPFGSRPRPTLVGTAIGGVASRKERGRGAAETSGVRGLGRRWLVVDGDGVGDLVRHGRLLRRRQSEAMPASASFLPRRARRGATGRNRPKADGEAGGPAWPRSGQKEKRVGSVIQRLVAALPQPEHVTVL
jgi:hypothetical protein